MSRYKTTTLKQRHRVRRQFRLTMSIKLDLTSHPRSESACSPPGVVLVLVGVVEAEGRVDGGALVHHLQRAPRVGADVADRDHTVRQTRRA